MRHLFSSVRLKAASAFFLLRMFDKKTTHFLRVDLFINITMPRLGSEGQEASADSVLRPAWSAVIVCCAPAVHTQGGRSEGGILKGSCP